MDYIKQLRMKRCEREMTQGDVDKDANLSQHTMFKFEKGQIKNITIIKKIAEFFGGEIVINFNKEG